MAIEKEPKLRSPWLWRLILAGSVTGALALLLLGLPQIAASLLRREHDTADWRTTLLSDRAATQHPRIAVVFINEETLQPYAYNSPIDRGLLAKIVTALDGAGARAVGMDFFYAKPTEPDKDRMLIDTLRGTKAAVVLGAVDARGGLKPYQQLFQRQFLGQTGKTAGFVNLRTEPDGVVRYRAGRVEGSEYPDSFADLLAKAGGVTSPVWSPRIAWLATPRDGAQTFLTLPAQALFEGTGENQAARANGLIDRLKGRIVLVGSDLPGVDRHATPFTAWYGARMHGVILHAHMVADVMDQRRFAVLNAVQANSLLAALAIGGFVFSWRLGLGRIVLIGWTMATGALLIADIIVFWQARIILPFTLASLAWFFGVAGGHAFGRLRAAWPGNSTTGSIPGSISA